MRKVLLSLLVVVLLAAAGAVAGIGRTAATAAQTVTISKSGYKPTAVSITVGDAVVFKNTDTVAHTVGFNSTTGVNCGSVVPLVIPAGQSASCTFSSAGKFKFSDAASNKKAFHGTVTVAAALVSSFAVTPKAVVYGGKSTLAGKLASGQTGQSLKVFALACGDTKAKALTTITTTAGGAFTYQPQPAKHTTYTVQAKGSTSSAVTVSVKPLLQLKRAGHHRYTLSVSAAQSFTGKVATFQRFRPALKRWVKVKRVTLGASVAGTAPTMVTSAKFRSGLRAHLRVRASLGPRQVGSCYLTGQSNTIRSG
ncbi:MAG TPA: cupredoxin domain-containing protein [Gaiellaceae bacterium]|nr:cupredoxin domain-containing protein [Gaiellaceae bacterium]